jgi:hypothetical protein
MAPQRLPFLAAVAQVISKSYPSQQLLNLIAAVVQVSLKPYPRLHLLYDYFPWLLWFR